MCGFAVMLSVTMQTSSKNINKITQLICYVSISLEFFDPPTHDYVMLNVSKAYPVLLLT